MFVSHDFLSTMYRIHGFLLGYIFLLPYLSTYIWIFVFVIINFHDLFSLYTHTHTHHSKKHMIHEEILHGRSIVLVADPTLEPRHGDMIHSASWESVWVG